MGATVVDVVPIRRKWRGIQFDSQLEADWCATFEAWGMEYRYHPGSLQLSNGEWWEPDFQLDNDVIFEVKGKHNHRLHKAWIAQEMGFKVVVGRSGWIPPQNQEEHPGAVWEPTYWVIKNIGSRMCFVDTRTIVGTAVADWVHSADIAYEYGLEGIRWFKAVGDDQYA